VITTLPATGGQARAGRPTNNVNQVSGGENNGLDITNDAQNHNRKRLAAAGNAAGVLPAGNNAAAAPTGGGGAPVTPVNPAHQDDQIVNTIHTLTSPAQQQTLQAMMLEQQRLLQFLMGVQFPSADEANGFDYNKYGTDYTNTVLVELQRENRHSAEPTAD